MDKENKATNGGSHSLLRARRKLIVNSALSVCLVTFAAALHLTRGEKGSESGTVPVVPEKVWSLPQLAHLKGEMQALREYPGTMPDFEEAWARKHAEQAIRLDRDFEGAIEGSARELANEYYKGYTERFKDYYESHAARAFGYHHGIKYNPDLNGYIPRNNDGLLNTHRKKLEELFDINDEATWRLFCDAFDKGFVEGYIVVEEGITVQSHWDEIRLFNE